ncbi:hypothetical protein TEA_020594 [Camellia sinensis var. sinensis]|uniref:Uncharacterized protein n=1 Tax=Camellia sinensis var. sinensis TaxID=542762 RepID=A0A4S4EJV8_CAMSN|nr:hypothetical protein TEA_020594 [Camellia sinensis var. sinensis]
MAGMLPGDPSHQGMYEGGPYNFSQEKPEDGGRWYFSRKEIEENSPSRQDGIDLKKETYIRKSYCTFLQDLGMRLKVFRDDLDATTTIILTQSHNSYHRSGVLDLAPSDFRNQDDRSRNCLERERSFGGDELQI